MQPKTLWDKILGHMSIQSKFQLSRASEFKTVTWKPFSIVAAPQFTERLKQLGAHTNPNILSNPYWAKIWCILLEQRSQGQWISFTSSTELKSGFPFHFLLSLSRGQLVKPTLLLARVELTLDNPNPFDPEPGLDFEFVTQPNQSFNSLRLVDIAKHSSEFLIFPC